MDSWIMLKSGPPANDPGGHMVQHKGLLLAALTATALTAGCSPAAKPGPAPTTGAPATRSAAGTAPAGSAGPSTGAGDGLPHGEGPIPDVVADAVATAWSERWHATPIPDRRPGIHMTRLTVDFPAAHGQLYMIVERPSAESTAVSMIYCGVIDNSLGVNGYITMTRKIAEQVVAGCAGPALRGDEPKRVTDFLAGHAQPDTTPSCTPTSDGTCPGTSDHQTDLGRFQLVVRTGPKNVSMWLVGRKP
ncbi:hypothetical protein [Dactylosporangium matsuzakiense]|nr:hypothetical protein [Dactylosporangium matsuzakiense]UWZ48529.1 hypothetical protein Dmats_20255 [Dactylosporangium matsuzakiense]